MTKKKRFFFYLKIKMIFSYNSLDKPSKQYTNGDPLKYPNHIPYQQQFLSSQSGFHRPQSQRTNHQR